MTPPPGFNENVRAQLKHWLLGAAVIAPMFCLIVAAWTFEETGSWGAVRFFVVYALPLFIAAPLWARTRVDVVERLPPLAIALDAGVLLLSVARFAASEVFPFSGHMLFLAHTLLTSRAGWYRWLAVALIAETTVFKLLLWRDTRSWMMGLLFGMATGMLSLWLVLQRHNRLLRSAG